MSRLDKIFKPLQPTTSDYKKAQIKSLILDLIGEDDPIQTRANEIRQELRKKIKEL